MRAVYIWSSTENKKKAIYAIIITIYDEYATRLTFGLERNLEDKEKIRFELAFKYLGDPSELSKSDITTVYFKIQYYPSWGEFWGNTLSNET